MKPHHLLWSLGLLGLGLLVGYGVHRRQERYWRAQVHADRIQEAAAELRNVPLSTRSQQLIADRLLTVAKEPDTAIIEEAARIYSDRLPASEKGDPVFSLLHSLVYRGLGVEVRDYSPWNYDRHRLTVPDRYGWMGITGTFETHFDSLDRMRRRRSKDELGDLDRHRMGTRTDERVRSGS